jgi:putative ABC transport system ATP-binding protein
MSDQSGLTGCALADVVVEYRSAGERFIALDGVSHAMRSGRVTVVAGPSGSGKSTMIRLLAGFDRPTSGTVHIGEHEISSMPDRQRRRLRRRSITLIHQRPMSNLLGDLTAQQHIDFVRTARGAAASNDPLPEFGLGHRRRAFARHLSGGEQQRLAFAMATVANAHVVLADEPTAELDRHHARLVIDALSELAGQGRTVVVASHDDDIIAVADEVVRLTNGRADQ